ncbi:MAG: universal stress protein [Rubrivivax sp.]|nr:universal stress protein [Rubrivivax sp.]MDP3225790.1 universal stress protein [Rubrivivax sp.]MDP3610683.1 universal stress protein [Rubrivivax sp.]
MYKRLLVPVDGGDLSDRAIPASLELARQLGATVVGFVAEPMPPIPSSPRNATLLRDELREHAATSRAHAEGVLVRFENAAREAGVPFEGWHDEVPRVHKAIIAAAESRSCDMIVMVTHGRGAFGEFLFGSQTKAVLSESQIPLLVLH